MSTQTASILEIASDAADELSLDRPATVVNVTNVQTSQKLYRHMLRTARRLAEMDWPCLHREHTFTTVAAAAQPNALPDDFQRFVPETFFNRTKRWRVLGPLTAEEWQANEAVLVTRVHDSYMQRGTSILITPTPPAGETMAFEYITAYIGTDSTGAIGRTRFTSDEDKPFFDPELMTLGTVWRYRKAEGLDYAEEFREYQLRLIDLFGAEGGRRRISMSPTDNARVPLAPVVPDTLVF